MTGPVLNHLGPNKLELGPANVPGAGHWRSGFADGIAWLALDKRQTKVNTISGDVIRELADHLTEIEAAGLKALVIRSAKPGGFAVGADISEFESIAEEASDVLRQAHAVLDRLEALECPTIAILHGSTLGAGFELALACDYRIGTEGASVGFPEVRLGLHPGLGGTFRLTTLIDPVAAMSMMLRGKTAHTGKAEKLGIFDIVTKERHVATAVQDFADRGKREERESLKSNALQLQAARSYVAREMRAEVDAVADRRHYPAPHALIDLWEEHGGDRAAMQEAEIQSFARLLDTETARNLIRAFFLRQELKAGTEGGDAIDHVHVVGAGTMGRDIAVWAAMKGKTVTLNDVKLSKLGEAVKAAGKTCKDKYFNDIETRDTLDRLIPDPNGYGLAKADLVIEAVSEDAELKRQLFKELGEKMAPGSILASNTSSLRLKELVGDINTPGRFAGLHFFNPVSEMELVEVVSQPKTTKKTTDRLSAFCAALDRLPARVSDHPGFLVNRALTPYMLEAMTLLDEGHAKESIDRAATRFGMPVGPIALADRIGLDICLSVATNLSQSLEKELAAIPGWLRDMVRRGKTGKKAGEGLYDWADGTPDGNAGEDLSPDLTDRLILPMLDACVECLRKGVAESEDQVDAVMIFATGFAPFRGGPMRYVHTRGAVDIRDRLTAFTEEFGPRFTPDAGWSRFD